MEEGERQSESERCSAPSQTSDQQTTTETSSQKRETDEDDIETKLDISSDKFDPLLVLYSPQVQLPYPNIKCFNNIAEYESFLKGGRGRAKPENVEKRLRKAQKGKADPERIERLKRLMVNNPVEEGEGSGVKRPPRQRKTAKNVLTRMPLHTGSPLGQLNRCVQEKIRVKVHIRTFKGLRGVCSGFVVAFDKFWNLAMVDVDETYREPLLGQALYHEKALTVTRLFEKLKVQETVALSEVERKSELQSSSSHLRRTDPKHTQERSESSEKEKTTLKVTQKSETKPKVEYGRVHTRHVNQLFIRGENILLVNIQQD
ncbi:U7 snRNA-associated Sm LSm11 [Labeo rohita]|uniref:U7 snRNA-associated Sm LSm11 n=2 Tax=Labeo rohita TaxID=84645 RepID=A0A498LGB0_LABRO|nr:U7 snRNA-associated Sm-like protein LSm11 [Labeo rohita]KAI2656888.1 U7 snRNA-associated Sm-like protein LSm11 [Labeo rohita]RXN07358.1 U7 snRNA-associated Sm LSm11 [Labeo rohita]RXN22113.1 U7 snRNA-associated Sm LSm11 [Labeo rohita]